MQDKSILYITLLNIDYLVDYSFKLFSQLLSQIDYESVN